MNEKSSKIKKRTLLLKFKIFLSIKIDIKLTSLNINNYKNLIR